MMIAFGKHAGKSLEYLILRQPDYVMWMLDQKAATDWFADAKRELRTLIASFDQKPMVIECYADCGNCATRGSVGRGFTLPYWWCDACDPCQLGASPSSLVIIRTYLDVVGYVAMRCGGRRADLRKLIRELAHAKGLPTRAGRDDVVGFFR
jgi:hypothetical protein